MIPNQKSKLAGIACLLVLLIVGVFYLYKHVQYSNAIKQNQVTWAEVKLLVEQCKVDSIDLGAGAYSHIWLKGQQYKTIVDYHPTVSEFQEIIEGASSTCGSVPVGRAIP